MQTVIHKKFGQGKVVSKEVKEIGAYIIVEFENGKLMKMSIPESFEMDGIEAQGSLKEEVDKAIAEKRAKEEKLTLERKAATVSIPVVSKNSKKRWIPSCALSNAYEKYLIDNGYKIESDSGNPSTVYAYGNAVDKIIEMEGLTWNSLANDIDNIVKIYGEGGPKWSIGKKSNETYINALKRFKEMLNP